VVVPPTVNTPDAMMSDPFEVAEVVMSWKCSVPVAAGAVRGAALAAVTPVTAMVAAAAVAAAPVSSLL
jgi:hypothetical protein